MTISAPQPELDPIAKAGNVVLLAFARQPQGPVTMAFLRTALSRAGSSDQPFAKVMAGLRKSELLGVAPYYARFPVYNTTCLTYKGELAVDALLGRDTKKFERGVTLAMLELAQQGGVWLHDKLPEVGPWRVATLFEKAKKAELIVLGNGRRESRRGMGEAGINAGLLTPKGATYLQKAVARPAL